MEERRFTVGELAKFDGKEGRPAYIAFEGKVYDVSESLMWQEGEHEDEHRAGVDLTEDMDFAPHSEDVLAPFSIVGVLEG